MGMELWLGIVTMRIHRPRTRNVFTALKDCDPPLTRAMHRVRPWVGRTEPSVRGIPGERGRIWEGGEGAV